MLKSLGLNEGENEVYLQLLRNGLQEAKSISSNLDIPISKTYHYLGNLEHLGLLIKSRSRPALYSPIDPKHAIQLLLDLRREEVQQLELQAKYLEKELYNVSDIRTLDSNALQIHIGEKLREKNAQVMMQAEKLVQIAIQVKQSHFENENLHLNNLFIKLHDLYRRNVKIQIIFGIPESLSQCFQDFLIQNVDTSIYRNIRSVEMVHTIFYIIDKSKVLIKIIDPLSGEYNFTSVIIWEEMFVDLFNSKFYSLWLEGTPFDVIDIHS